MNWRFMNQTLMQSEGTSDKSPPEARKQICSEDDSDEEVPSSFPIVRPSKTLDFGEDDNVEETYKEADTSSSDEEDVSLAVIEKEKVNGWKKGAKKKTTSKGGKTVRSLFALCFVFIMLLLSFIAENKSTSFPRIRIHTGGATYPGMKLHDRVRGSYDWDGPEGSGVLDSICFIGCISNLF
jgi:hypothetical protein